LEPLPLRNPVPGENLRQTAFVDTRQGIDPEDAGDDSLPFELMQTAGRDDEFFPAPLFGDAQASLVDIAQREPPLLSQRPQVFRRNRSWRAPDHGFVHPCLPISAEVAVSPGRDSLHTRFYRYITPNSPTFTGTDSNGRAACLNLDSITLQTEHLGNQEVTQHIP
jgi:hypothetical protein